MKEGWEYKKLGEVIEHLRTGLNPRTHFKLNTPDAEGYYVTVRELKGFSIEPDEKTDKVNRAAIKRINERSNLKIGDVLFSGTGTIGKTALVSELPENWNIKEGVYAMTPKHSELDSKYFIYYIGSDLFLRLVNDKAAGTGVRSIPMKELVKLPITIPPLSEQQSIVDYLDSAFAKIDAMKANAEKALGEAKALFQASLKEMLEPKEGWEEKKLGDIVSFFSGYAFESKRYTNNNDDILLICGDNIVHCDFRWETIKHWPKEEYDDLKRFSLEKNDIVLAMDRPWVKSGLKIAKITPKELPSLLIQRTACIRAPKDISSDFVFYALQTEKFIKHLVSLQNGVGVPHISGKQILSYKISIPKYVEQQSIVATLDSLRFKVDRLQANYAKISQECDALKQAILRQVFE